MKNLNLFIIGVILLFIISLGVYFFFQNSILKEITITNDLLEDYSHKLLFENDLIFLTKFFTKIVLEFFLLKHKISLANF